MVTRRVLECLLALELLLASSRTPTRLDWLGPDQHTVAEHKVASTAPPPAYRS